MSLFRVPLPLAAVALAAITLCLSGCNDSDASGPTAADGLAGKLVLTGSSTVAPLAGEIAKRFEALHPQVRADVQTGGSSRGNADATRGNADIGMSSRDLKPSETDGVHPSLRMKRVCCRSVIDCYSFIESGPRSARGHAHQSDSIHLEP